MELLPIDNPNQKVLKIAYFGHHPLTNENFIKCIFNIIANVENDEITFSRYLDFATKNLQTYKMESMSYIISPNKNKNQKEINIQNKKIKQLYDFFKTKPIAITYYCCINPKEVFEIKGFHYSPMMYIDNSCGLADFGNIIFSGNNAEMYTHEIVPIYSNTLHPEIHKFLDEGIATYLAGSGKYDY